MLLILGNPRRAGDPLDLIIDEGFDTILQKAAQGVVQMQGRDPVHHGPHGQRQMRDDGRYGMPSFRNASSD